MLPEALKQQLTVGGRLFAIIGEAPLMEAKLIVRESEQGWRDIMYLKPVPVLYKPHHNLKSSLSNA